MATAFYQLTFFVFIELQEVVLAADLLEGDMIAEENLEDFLRNTGIKSPKEEVEKILQSDFVSGKHFKYYSQVFFFF